MNKKKPRPEKVKIETENVNKVLPNIPKAISLISMIKLMQERN